MKTATQPVPDLLGALKTAPRRGRPPTHPSKPATQIAEEMELHARGILAVAAILRGTIKVA